MIHFNIDESAAILLAAEELFEITGQLWININGEEFYMPEFIDQLKRIKKIQLGHSQYN